MLLMHPAQELVLPRQREHSVLSIPPAQDLVVQMHHLQKQFLLGLSMPPVQDQVLLVARARQQGSQAREQHPATGAPTREGGVGGAPPPSPPPSDSASASAGSPSSCSTPAWPAWSISGTHDSHPAG